MAYKSRFYQQKYQGQEQNNVESNDNSRYKSQFYRSGAYKNAEGASGLKPTETKERLNTELWQRVDNNSVTNTPRKQTANITHMGSVSEISYGSNQQSEYERLLNLNPQKAKASIQSLRTQIEKIPNYSSEELREKYPNHQAAVKHMSDLEDQIKKIEEDIQKSEKIKKYASYQNAEDFLQFSSKGAAIKNPTYKEAEGNAYIFGWRPGADPVGNIVTYSRDNYEHIRDEENGESRGVGAVGKSLYHYMSDDEVGLYNYILAKHGDKEAKEYLDSIEETLNYRSGTEQAKLIRDNENGFLRTLGTVNYGVGAGLDQSISGAKQFFSDEKLPTSATQYGSAYIREDLEDAGPKILGSSLGQIGYDTLTTTANMAPSILLSSITAGLGAPAAVASGLGAASMGLSASGNAYGQALSEGYGKEEARSYSLLVGASEAALQYLLGGISKLGGKLTGNVAKKTVQNIDNALLRIAVDTGIHMASEGSEEYLQEILEPAFRNLCFDENNEIKLVSEDAAYSFLLGALTSGFMEGGNIAKSGISLNKTGEAIQRQGKYEELLENALTMDPSSEAGRIASQLKNGTLHVNSSNIGELYLNYAAEGGNLDFVSAPVENTETVQKAAQQNPEAALYQAAMEKVTGENISYQQNQDTEIEHPAFNRLESAAISSKVNSMVQSWRAFGTEGKAAFEAFAEATPEVIANGPDQFYKEFSQFYNAGAKKDNLKRMQEKYRGLLDRQQQIVAYTAGKNDASASLQSEKAVVSQQKVYQQGAGKVTMENNLAGLVDNAYSERLNETVKSQLREEAGALGLKVVIDGSISSDGKQSNGNGKLIDGILHISADASDPIGVVRRHEITHRLQELAPEQYRNFRDYAMKFQKDSTQAILDKQVLYGKNGQKLSNEEAMDEIAADFAGKMLDDEAAIQRMVRENRTLAEKIRDIIRDMVRQVKEAIGKADPTLERAQKLWDDAFKAAEKQVNRIQGQKNTASESGKGRHSIKYDENNRPFVVVEEDILEGIPKNQWVKAVKDNLREKFPDGVTVGNNIIHINQQSRKEMTYSKYTRHLMQFYPELYANKLRATNNADEILKASQNYVNEALIHPRKDNIQQFARGDVLLRIGNYDYSANVIVAMQSNRKLLLYDIININPTSISIKLKETDTAISENPSPGAERSAVSISTDSISNSSENVNGKFSFKDYSDQEKKEHNAQALEYFGRTFTWKETGYLLLNGKKLDFSGKHEGAPGGYRTVDHRDISDALGEDYGGDDYSDAMVQFMREGNIRISPESNGINLSVLPTAAQFEALDDYISKARGEVVLDVDDDNGNTIFGVEYPRGTRAIKVINDIKQYFKDGIKPYISETSKFHYSIKDQSPEARIAKLEELNQYLREEVKLSDGPTTDRKAVNKIAKELVKEYSSNVDIKNLGIQVQELYDLIARGYDKDGNDISFEAIRDKAKEISTGILEGSLAQGNPLYEDYAALRDQIWNTKLKISEADSKNITDFSDFRKRNFGRMKISKGDTNVDSVYQELSTMYPEFFDNTVIRPADQLMQIEEVLDTLQPVMENPYDNDMEEAASYLAADLIERFYDVPQRKTFADKQEAKLTQQKIKNRNQLEKLRADKNERIEAIRKQGQERIKKAVAKEQQKREEKIEALKEHYQQKDAAGRERRSAAELRRKIIKHTQKLSQKLLHPTDKQHIPEELRGAVAEVLNAINLESSYTIDPETAHPLIKKDGTQGALVGKHLKDQSGLPTKRTTAFIKMKAELGKVLERDGDITVDPTLLGVITEGQKSLFDQVIELSDVRIADMNTEQLQAVWQVIRGVEHAITTAGKMLSQSKYETTKQAAFALHDDTAGRKMKNRSALRSKLELSMEDPYTFFHHFGEAGHALYRMLHNAQDRQQMMLNHIIDEMKKIVDEKAVAQFKEEVHHFQTENGGSLVLSTAHAMELYLLSKREQAKQHLLVGGIQQPEIKSAHVKKGQNNIQLTVGDIGDIVDSLTEEQKAIADKIQKLTDILAGYGNEASMAAYGYRKFTGENYWPIHSASTELKQEIGKGENIPRNIANIGAAKSLNPQANNALVLDGIFDTFASHTSDMIDYASWLLPMEDMSRILNYKFKSEDGKRVSNVQQLLNSVAGPEAVQYYKKLMEDIQNGARGEEDGWSTLFKRAVGNIKGASVGGNIRVIIQQPTAFFKAAVVLSPEDMAKGAVKRATRGSGWEKAKKYAPVASLKERAGFDMKSPTRMSEELYDGRSRLKKINDWLSKGASKADEITWGKLWNACEWATVKERGDLKRGSEQFYQATAELFNEVIDQTQVVGGILQKSGVMRSNSLLNKQATAFMGEPIMAYNIFLRAWDDLAYETGPGMRKKNIKKLGRAAAALAVTDVVNALAQSLVDAIRDDDEDKKYWERFWSAFGGNVADNMNPLGKIPYAKDLLSILNGYKVVRMDVAVLEDVFSSHDALKDSLSGEGKKTIPYAVKQLAVSVGKLFGIPAHTILRDIWGVMRTFAVETENIPLQYEMEKAIYQLSSENNKGQYMDIMFRALRQDDFDSYEKIKKDLIDAGVKPSAIESGMNSRYENWIKKDSNFVLSQKARDMIGSVDRFEEEEKEKKFSENDLNSDAHQQYTREKSSHYRQMEDELKAMDAYSMLDNSSKNKALDSLEALAKEMALQNASAGKYEMDTKWMLWASEGQAYGVDEVEAVLFKTAYDMAQSDKDENGNAIIGSKKEKVLEAADDLMPWLSDEELQYLLSNYWKP